MNDEGRGLEELIGGVVAPMVVHGDAGFPDRAVALLIENAFRRDDLLGADKIAAIFGGVLRQQRTEAGAAGLQPIVNDDAGLELADHADEVGRTPLLPHHVVVGEIEPHDVDLSVVFTKLAHLAVHVVQIVVEIVLRALEGFVVAFGMLAVAVVREIGMVPIDDGIIEADLEPFGAEGVDVFAHEVAMRGRVGRLVIGQLGIEQAEAVVVLGGEHGVFHAGLFGELRPLFRVVIHGIKFVEIGLIGFHGDTLLAAHPFAARRNGVQPPMDEHAETILPEPGNAPVVFFPIELEHNGHPFFVYAVSLLYHTVHPAASLLY